MTRFSSDEHKHAHSLAQRRTHRHTDTQLKTQEILTAASFEASQPPARAHKDTRHAHAERKDGQTYRYECVPAASKQATNPVLFIKEEADSGISMLENVFIKS